MKTSSWSTLSLAFCLWPTLERTVCFLSAPSLCSENCYPNWKKLNLSCVCVCVCLQPMVLSSSSQPSPHLGLMYVCSPLWVLLFVFVFLMVMCCCCRASMWCLVKSWRATTSSRRLKPKAVSPASPPSPSRSPTLASSLAMPSSTSKT